MPAARGNEPTQQEVLLRLAGALVALGAGAAAWVIVILLLKDAVG